MYKLTNLYTFIYRTEVTIFTSIFRWHQNSFRKLRGSLSCKIFFKKSFKYHHIKQEMSPCIICSVLNSAVLSMFASSGWGNAWRPRATMRASATPSGIRKSLQFPLETFWSSLITCGSLWPALKTLSCHGRLTIIDAETFANVHTRLCTPCSWITVLTSSA